MKKIAIAVCCFGALFATSVGAEAKGCIKGALVGGVAGHYAGHHGLIGAAGGCFAGRQLAKRNAARQAQPINSPTTH